MTTLATNKVRHFQIGVPETRQEYDVAAATVIYQGAAVGEDASGYARPLQAGDPFLGFAEAKADNQNGVASDKRVEVKARGIIELTVAGVAVTSNDRPAVYASDDDTFTLTAGGNSLIGFVSRYIGPGEVARVEIDALAARAALHT